MINPLATVQRVTWRGPSLEAGSPVLRPLLHPGEQKRSRGSLARVEGTHPRAIVEVTSRELGNRLMKRICLDGGRDSDMMVAFRLQKP